MQFNARLSAFLMGAAVAVPALAQSQIPDEERRNNYWAVQGGVNHLSSWPGVVDFGGPRADATLTLKRGSTFGLVLGRQYGKARYDIEYQHGSLKVSDVKLAALSQAVSASIKYDVLTVNAYRQGRFSDSMLGFVGIGVGYGRVNLPTIGLSNGCKCFSEASRGSGVVQVRTGLDYELSEDGLAYLQLGWTRLPGAKSGALPSVTYGRRSVAMLSVGYRGRFN